jgi:hypothetical protein
MTIAAFPSRSLPASSTVVGVVVVGKEHDVDATDLRPGKESGR